MTWNYRIVRYRNGQGYGLHEVYYDDAGTPETRTVDPVGFACNADEGAQGVIASLWMALTDAQDRPVLDDFVKEETP